MGMSKKKKSILILSFITLLTLGLLYSMFFGVKIDQFEIPRALGTGSSTIFYEMPVETIEEIDEYGETQMVEILPEDAYVDETIRILSEALINMGHRNASVNRHFDRFLAVQLPNITNFQPVIAAIREDVINADVLPIPLEMLQAQATPPQGGIRQGLDLAGGSVIVYEAQVAGIPSDDEMNTAVAMLQARLTALGYTEATVARQGDRRIRLEIPSVANPEAAMAELGATANLTFTDPDGNVLLDGSHVANAQYQTFLNERGIRMHEVLLNFTPEGQVLFAEATELISQLDDNRLVIMMDEDFISSPSVRERIDSDSAVISGQFTADDARWLADIIRVGRLPFSLTDVESQSIGATLGENALRTGMLAGGIGILVILIVMLLVYKLAGLIANIALLAYLGLLLLIMTLFRVNLSLPGIAGIILSIGLAVDANILIFERMKEEFALGKGVNSAMDAGFKRAFTAIIDAELTTLIAVAVLFTRGTGPIQGFAMTLGIGTVLAFFTAIFLTRWMLKLLINMDVKNPKLFGAKIGGAENV